jgi:hypothetical protein
MADQSLEANHFLKDNSSTLPAETSILSFTTSRCVQYKYQLAVAAVLLN